MREIIFIGVAGLVGTLGRYWLSGALDQRFGPAFPVGTLVVNLLGCFLAGFLFHAVTERFVIDPIIRSALLIGFLGGTQGKLSLEPLLRKSLTVKATTLRRTPAARKEELVRALSAFALERLARGELKPVIDSVHALSRVADAHRTMESNRNLGKIVLTVD